jgi:hypothetical protein
MSKNTYFHTRFWQDSYVCDLDPSEKLIFAYALTSPYLGLTGIYEVPIKFIAIETGIEKEMVAKILKRFQSEKKIVYQKGWLCVLKYPLYQSFKGEPLLKAVEKEIKAIPKDILEYFIGYGYPIDTLSIGYMVMERVMEMDMVMETEEEKPEKVVSVAVKKERYGEFQNVALLLDEYQKLIEALNQTAVDTLISELDCYIESTGKKYKSHYATLQNWARRKISEHKIKNTLTPNKSTADFSK